LQFNTYLLLLWLVCLLAPLQLSAERYAYPDDEDYSGKPQVNLGSAGRYQWRPLNERRGSTTTPNSDWKGQDYQPTQHYSDYTDTPFGLPRGSYRPVKQRHEITPHQGYRFRPLSPTEQQRLKQRNLVKQDSQQSSGRPRFRPQHFSSEVGRFGYSSGKQYRFRPDERLDSGFSSETTPFYTSEPHFQSP
jgi:hypothetical protein